MRCYVIILLLAGLLFSTTALANTTAEQEITFRETPQALLTELLESTQHPLSFSSKDEFHAIATQQKKQSNTLIQQLILLARLYLQSGVVAENKYQHAQTVIDQLDIVASTPIDKAAVIMLKGRLKGRQSQDYEFAISQYNDALNLISSDLSTEANYFKLNLHQSLSTLNLLVLQRGPALTHLNKYREIAYQVRNDYFIASAEMALGKYHNRNNDHTKSLQYYTEAFRVGNRIKYPGIKAHAQLNLARTYRDLEQWDDALRYAHDAVTSFQGIGQDAYIAESLTVIAMIYGQQTLWHKAIDYYLNALQINEKLGSEIAQALNNHNIAEAYLNLGNPQAALTSITTANNIFVAKKVNHYLVYNEALFSQILLELSEWRQAVVHANNALKIAKQKNLMNSEREVLSYLLKAYRELGEMDKALEVADQLIALSPQNLEGSEDNSSASGLTEQKLKFDLSLLQNQLQDSTEQIQQKQLIITLILGLFVLTLIVFTVTLNRSSKLIAAQRHYKKLCLLEPITQMNGLRACLKQLQQYRQTELAALALIKIEALTRCDTQMGLTQSAIQIKKLITELSQRLSADIYIVKPGQYACCFKHDIDAQSLHQQVLEFTSNALCNNPLIPSFTRNMALSRVYVGHIKLPLLSNPDISVTPEIHFETVQYALAAAMTQPESTYVSLKSLNFAPATIFRSPLYLNLTQALKRGIIKAESNLTITEDWWPN
ncbi:tetratricopeptide repeat protein [Shewanella gaetbuli]|uniref:Tetratricopeptide repeat protein n=1 Tax=Shewanella gaetbuli TaxID=220752 RepID=A0A9X1ZT24_9GAMM|nr:tetratricopeptide repeat protein [Shewanella gaetbuli]MCL1141621.1 tetratricopeptide repeat protein [Shewanella gaetbuli]